MFIAHGVNAVEQLIFRKKLSGREIMKSVEKAPPTIIVIESYGGSHHRAKAVKFVRSCDEADRAAIGKALS